MSSSFWTPSRRGLIGGAGAALLAPSALADAPALVRAIALARDEEGVRLDLDLSRPVRPSAFFLSGPDRFVVDLPAARVATGAGAAGQGPGAGFVLRYRYAPRPDGSARIVLDLSAPAALHGAPAAPSRTLRFSLSAPGGGPVALEPAAPATRGARRTIVIDAGHGGRDPGAVGVTGVREKDVVLDAALMLREALEARGRYDVVLTRDADAFIPLPDRVRIARDARADLFVSLHADASPNAGAAGASVYTLSERGEDRARAMMDTQNWTLDTGPAVRGVVSDILVDLAQRETTNRSAVFAQTLIGRLEGEAPLLANTHRSASFFVLLAPDVPAVLLEMGFLTNAADERRLADRRQRERIAEAAADAIDHYFAAPRTYMARA